MQLRYRIFRSTFTSWQQLFAEAAEFASSIGPVNLVSVSHAVSGQDGTVTVW